MALTAPQLLQKLAQQSTATRFIFVRTQKLAKIGK
jgi:hypothetical protein